MWYNCLGLHECGGCSSTVGERECGKSGKIILDCMDVVDVPLLLVSVNVVNVERRRMIVECALNLTLHLETVSSK